MHKFGCLSGMLEENKELFSQNQLLDCCSLGRQGQVCLCKSILYRVRPYTFELLEQVVNHYEIIGTSKLPHYHLKHIVNHLQVFLNKASLDSYSKERIRKVPEPKPRVDHDEVQSLDQEDEKENNIEGLLSELKEASNSS